MANLLKWITGSSAAYTALATKNENALYFLTDTQEIYKGSQSFSESVIFYTDTLPATPAKGKMYVDTTTLAGSVWDGTTWQTITAPVENTIDVANITKGVTGKAVVDYVADQLATAGAGYVTDVTYDDTAKAISFVKGGATSTLPLTKLASSLTYDGATGKLSILDSASAVLSEVNIPLDNFVKSGTYDNVAEALVLTLQDNSTVSIPAADLVTLYEAEDTSTVDLTITNTASGNVITAAVKVSAIAGNALTVEADGLYVAPTDTSNKMDKVAAGTATDQIIVADANGNAAASGKTVGGATLSETPDSNTVATEAAVQAVKTEIETTTATVLESYVLKSSVIADGASVNTVTPDGTKLISEKAIVDLFGWQEI
jgi:hypothetical protein